MSNVISRLISSVLPKTTRRGIPGPPRANGALILTSRGLVAFAGLCLLLSLANGLPARQPGNVEPASGRAPVFITFEAPGAGTGALQGTIAIGINATGEVIGISYVAGGVGHGFVRAANGAITAVDAPGAGTAKNQGTFPASINAAGEIAGMYADGNNVYHGFIRAAGGAITQFDVPGAGKTGHRGTIALGIDEAGAVTGTYEDANSLYHGFVRAPGGKITTFNAPGAAASYGRGTFPVGINTSGEIAGFYSGSGAGYHAFVRAASGAITDFDAPAATGGSTFALAINDGGAITGTYSDTNGVSHGFVRASDGTITQFDIPGETTAPSFLLPGVGGSSLNAAGDLTGFYVDTKNVFHGFVRAANGSVTAFEAPGAGTGSGKFQGTGGFGINTAGAIAGTYADSKSVFHGFVLSAMIPTTITLKSSASSSNYGRALTFTADVASSEGAVPDGEAVSFRKGAALLGTAQLTDGAATFKTSSLPVGTDSVTAVYAGDANFAGSVSKPLSEVISKAKVRVVLASSLNPSKSGQSVKFTATVASATSAVPAGTVTFKNGAVTLGTVALSAGKAVLATSALAVGTHSITAEYNGSADYLPKTSAALVQTVNKAAAKTTRVSTGNSSAPESSPHASQ